MSYIALDFEASCLPRDGRSFPIEVGIAENGSQLIRPHPSWQGWDWTREAQDMHGLSLQQLHDEGQPPATVLDELRHAIGKRRVIADSYLDAGWMATLGMAAGMANPIAIGHIDEVVDRLHIRSPELDTVMRNLQCRPFGRHRAGEDARWLAALIEGLHELAMAPHH